MATENKRRATVADADDDDLDDLDDVLDQFSTKPQLPTRPPVAPAPGPSSSAKPATAPADVDLDDEFSDDLMRDLAAGMETLMRDLMAGGESDDTPHDSKAAAAELDKTLKELHANMAAADPTGSSAGPSSSRTGDAAFQASLQATLDKLKSSEEANKAGDAEALDADAMKELQDLFAALGGDGAAGAAGGEDGALPEVFEGLLQQLMSKEILYEPLHDLSEKYPAYISQHRATLPADELTRYESQSALVTRIVRLFEQPDYSDDNPGKAGEILTLMNEMQSKGSPPQEIMGDMPPGWDMGPDGLPKLPDNCTIA